MSSKTHPMFAVLIGIDAYEHAADLKGPTQDLKLMGRLCDRLQIPDTNRKVLAGTGASVAKIQEALDWLKEALDDENATALIHFSGHGTLLNQSGPKDTLALAAYDFEPHSAGSATEQGLLTLNDLATRFDEPAERHTNEPAEQVTGTKLSRITVVLDCCWNQEDISTDNPIQIPELLDCRLLLSCSRNDKANEIWMDGRQVGAFTWALTTALSRWEVVDWEGNKQMTVNHAQLLDRVRQLFASLGVEEQTPMLAGPSKMDILPVFQRSMEWNPAAIVSTVPHRAQVHRQLWGGDQPSTSKKYILEWLNPGGQWKAFAFVQAYNSFAAPDNRNKEHWSMNGTETWNWLNYTQNHPPAGEKIRVRPFGGQIANQVQWLRVGPTVGPIDTVEPDAGNQIYKFVNGIVQFKVTGSGGTYYLHSIRWWAMNSVIENHNNCFNPTSGMNQQTYTRTTATQSDWNKTIGPPNSDLMKTFAQQQPPSTITITQ